MQHLNLNKYFLLAGYYVFKLCFKMSTAHKLKKKKLIITKLYLKIKKLT